MKLVVYSASAVASPLVGAAKLFRERTGVEVQVVAGKVRDHLVDIRATKVGDLISSGAEQVIDAAEAEGLVLKEARSSLGLRRSVILVQKCNPKNIRALEDLARDGVTVSISVEGCLPGVWDDICSRAGLVDEVRRNIAVLADGCGALMRSVNLKQADAGFGWNAFVKLIPETLEAVELPERLQVFRSTNIGILSCSKNVGLAKQFISFLRTEEAKTLYREMGWIT